MEKYFKPGLLAILCTVLMCGCTNKKKEEESSAKTANVSLSSMLLTVPSSISKVSSSISIKSKVRTFETDSSVTGIYDGIRSFIGLADSMSKMIKQISDALIGPSSELGVDFSSITEASPFVQTIPEDPNDPSGPRAVKIVKNAAGATYEFTVTLYWMSSSMYKPGIIMDLSFTSSTEVKGRVTADIATLDSSGGVGKFQW